jgi:type VI secretion system FHA domain protein
MELTLTVIDHDGAPPPAVARVTARNGDMTIGRIEGNDLVLASDEISRHHARILYRGRQFFLQDTSTNGVVLNGAATRVEPNSQVPLHDNDTLGVGSYLIRVSIPEDARGGRASYPGQRDGEQYDRDPLGGLLDGPAPNVLNVFSGGGSISGTGEPLGSPVPGATDEIETPPLIPQRRESRGSQPGLVKEGVSPPERVTPVEHEACGDLLDLLTGELLGQRSDIGASLPRDAGDAVDHADKQTGEGERARRYEREMGRKVAEGRDSSSSASTGEGGGNAVKAFIEGLGIDPGEIPSERVAEVMREAGELLLVMSMELVTMMRNRSTLKREIHADMTQFGARENNLFKFSVDGEVALRNRFVDRTPGFKEPTESAVEAFHDLRAHDAALIAGVRGALRSLVDRFLPSELEQRFQRESLLDKVLPQNRKAKCWDLFVETYDEVAADATDDFRRLFRSAFQSAYEDQVSRLKRERQTRHKNEPPEEEH